MARKRLGSISLRSSSSISFHFISFPSIRASLFSTLSSCTGTPSNEVHAKRKVLFLGTPSFSINVLSQLIRSSTELNYQICGIVTKPPNKKSLSPIHRYGNEMKIPVYTPNKISEKDFLNTIQEIQPDLCITAAYGNYLPLKFLQIPKYGTVNIHPSLLPKYRGASPVQRSLVNGDHMVGVTVLYTVKEMDAGPIITQSSLQLEGDEKSLEVLTELFRIGTKDLIHSLQQIFTSTPPSPQQLRLENQNSTSQIGTYQDHSLATQAPKIHHSEGNIDFQKMTATQIHNLGRGFSEWPGIWCIFHIHGPSRDDYVRVRLVTTRILSSSSSLSSPLPSPSPSILEPISPSNQVTYHSISGTKNGYLEVGCMDNSRLAILELQPQGKKVMTAKAFKNGLKEKKVSWYPILETDDSHHIQADRDSH